MSRSPSKQLGALLGRVPPATAGGDHTTAPYAVPVPYAAERSTAEREASTAASTSPAPQASANPEVPLQVLIPLDVRIRLNLLHAETRKPLRALVLEALRGIGIEVSDEDIAGKRGRKKMES